MQLPQTHLSGSFAMPLRRLACLFLWVAICGAIQLHAGPDDWPVNPPRAVASVGTLVVGRDSGSATLIGPRRDDGRIWALTAAHCVASGSSGTLTLRDGRSFTVRVGTVDRTSDIAWILVDSAGDRRPIPHATLVAAPPGRDMAVWHCGFGYRANGKIRTGKSIENPDSNGSVRYDLAVESGDSGGAIFLEGTALVVGVVSHYRTDDRLRYLGAWAGSGKRAAAIRPPLDANPPR